MCHLLLPKNTTLLVPHQELLLFFLSKTWLLFFFHVSRHSMKALWQHLISHVVTERGGVDRPHRMWIQGKEIVCYRMKPPLAQILYRFQPTECTEHFAGAWGNRLLRFGWTCPYMWWCYLGEKFEPQHPLLLKYFRLGTSRRRDFLTIENPLQTDRYTLLD